ncbi:MAG: DNA polymerase I [Elusimicrobia bacterium]|nr:DNA polymerase I [Elusimicrobiota bacterium]
MKPRLYLVDAHAYLHRAYHALPPLNNSKGEPVGALFGFARMLLNLLKKEKPDRVAVCFDHPDPTFRHKAYEAYKATRKETDGDLSRQLARAPDLARAMGFSTVELPGYEADDVMATLARGAVKEGIEAVLVTGDKDALQLISPGIRVLRDVAQGLWMDAEQVREKFGVSPSGIVDYLTLIGDSTDNIPGIKGIGPVSAAKLLNEFGGVAELMRAAKAGDSRIPAKTAKALVEGEKDALSATALLKLEENAPLKIGPKDCVFPRPDAAKLAAMLEALEFHSLLKEMIPETASSLPAPSQVSEGPSWRELPPEKVLPEMEKASTILVAALRHEGNLVDSSPAHLALALEDGKACFLDQSQAQRFRRAIAKVLEGRALKATYGLKEAFGGLSALGFELSAPWFDAKIAAYCLSPIRPKADPVSDGDWKGALKARLSRCHSHRELRRRMDEAQVLKLYDDVELPLVRILKEMEDHGVCVDEPYLQALSKEFQGDIEALKTELDELAGQSINVNSPKQLSELLFDKLKLPVVHKTAKGGRSTDEDCLKELSKQHPIPAKVLEYRELAKLKSTYIDGLLDRIDRNSGRVHTSFDQTGTETGRFSSSNPNLQNIPVRSKAGQRIRRAFVSAKGWRLLSADYSQIDLRVLAHMSADPVLKESFINGEDVHLRTACEIFRVSPDAVDSEMRRRAKAVNFGIVYGQTPFGLAAELGIAQREAQEIIHKYFERYRGVARWMEENIIEARRVGYARTFLGRIRHLPELEAKNTAVRQFGERAARNTPIQGGSADVIKLAMLKVHEGLSGSHARFKAKMLLQIHDELLFEVPRAELEEFAGWARKTMEQAVALSVPLVVDVKAGANWQDMEKIPEAVARERVRP